MNRVLGWLGAILAGFRVYVVPVQPNPATAVLTWAPSPGSYVLGIGGWDPLTGAPSATAIQVTVAPFRAPGTVQTWGAPGVWSYCLLPPGTITFSANCYLLVVEPA